LVLKTFSLEIPKNFHKFSLVFLKNWKTRNFPQNCYLGRYNLIRIQDFNDFRVLPCGTSESLFTVMNKVLQNESEIKEVQDHQLCNMILSL